MLARARHELNMYQPWAAGFEHHFEDYREEFVAHCAEGFAPLIKIADTLDHQKFARLGSLVDVSFEYPEGKGRNQQVVDMMREAEGKLVLFWGHVDLKDEKAMGKTLLDTIRSYLQEDRQLERKFMVLLFKSALFLVLSLHWKDTDRLFKGTPIWEEEPNEALQIVSPASPTTPTNLEANIADLSVNGASSTDRHFDIPPPKVKVKSKGIAQSATGLGTSTDATQQPGIGIDLQPIFKLGKRAFEVFSSLFYNPNQTDFRGEMP